MIAATAVQAAPVLSSRSRAAAPLRAASATRRPLRASTSHVVRAATADDATDDGKMVVAVTGATGFVGKALVERLLADGHEVRVLTRNAISARLALPNAALNGAKFYSWDTMKGKLEWYEAVRGCTGVVNLAGAPISSPWNAEYKKTLVKSRIVTTKRVVDAINALPTDERPTLVSSSAVGFYGTSKKVAGFSEKGKPGKDFLAKLCVDWEKEAARCESTTTVVRTGVVLEKNGGALAKILPVFQLYGGGPLGSGKQFVSWIHRDDLVELFVRALAEPKKYAGVVNGTAPVPTTMDGLCEAVAAATDRPNWLPVPGLALKVLLGEGATVVLDGQKVLPTRTQELGFEFKYEKVEEALEAIVAK
jgi:uncharacterized protein (TIGR01777 family)